MAINYRLKICYPYLLQKALGGFFTMQVL